MYRRSSASDEHVPVVDTVVVRRIEVLRIPEWEAAAGIDYTAGLLAAGRVVADTY